MLTLEELERLETVLSHAPMVSSDLVKDLCASYRKALEEIAYLRKYAIADFRKRTVEACGLKAVGAELAMRGSSDPDARTRYEVVRDTLLQMALELESLPDREGK